MNVGQDENYADEPLGGRVPGSERTRPTGTKRRSAGEGPAASTLYGEPAKSKFSVDAPSLLRPALKRWPWILLATVAGAVGGFFLASALWKISFSVSAQLVKHEPVIAQDAYKPRPVDVPTLIGRMEDPAFLRRVGDQLSPKMTSGQVLGHMRVMPERNSAIMIVTARHEDAGIATSLANVFARETVKFTQELQSQEASEALVYVMNDLVEAEKKLAEAQKQMPMLANGVAADSLASNASAAAAHRNSEKIESARDELTRLLARYTDAHPSVRQQRATIAALEAEAATGISAPPAGATAVEGQGNRAVSRDEWEISLYRLRELESLRLLLNQRKQQLELFKANPPGGFRITVPASADTLSVHRPWMKVGLLAVVGGLLGLIASSAHVLMREFVDTRLKTSEDVARVTGMPVIATLGDLRTMSLSAREEWAFRTWIALQDRLAFSPNHGLICGITSSRPGDGRSTWVGLLAGAARKCGFRVLTIATKPTADATVNARESEEAAAAAAAGEAAARAEMARQVMAAADAQVNGHTTVHAATATATATAPAPKAAATAKVPNPVKVEGLHGVPTARAHGAVVPRSTEIESLRGVSADSEFTALTASALFTPAQVTEKLMGPESDPLVHIPLPGWTWNLERRKQWQGALSVWRKIENVVILVELPPASVPESVLLASNLPNILWLVESGKSEASETRAQLQTLRHARCNLVGSVINRAMGSFTNGKLSRWMSCIALIAAFGLGGPTLIAQTAPAATGGETSPSAPGTFSVTSPAQRAEWQRRLTLGPGDVLTLGLFGDPDLTVEEVPIAPDGRISYLEAVDVMAAGLTVDELRERLTQEIAKFRREPQVIVVPIAYNSKKYFVLGKVAKRGVFTLDRPTTLLEAVAQAQGIETGMASDRSLIELADLTRSFVARGGRKLEVDLQKLFEQGDLSQNIAIEPNDYIYFPAATLKEVYVLGEVLQPGAYNYTAATGAVGAVAARGGFTDRAFKNKLLVIRGSLNKPQLFVVDALEVLSAKTPDLKLQPRDIVFVSKRPWYRAEELLDDAASAFVTSAVVTWTGIRVYEELHD